MVLVPYLEDRTEGATGSNVLGSGLLSILISCIRGYISVSVTSSYTYVSQSCLYKVVS
jgi:hypothetical protein